MLLFHSAFIYAVHPIRNYRLIKTFDNGIEAFGGTLVESEKDEDVIQEFHFSTEQFTEDQAIKWMREQGFSYDKKDFKKDDDFFFEPAIKKELVETDSLNMSFDSGEFGKGELTQEGFLRVPVKMSRTGVMNYGSVNKVKLPEDLFSKITVDSLRGLPICDEHPMVDGEYIFIDNKNVRQYAKGSVSEPTFDSKFLKGMVTIWDADLISDVKAGKKEVSLAYSKDQEYKSGDFDGQPYDVIQRNIVGNHLAITEKGRGGEQVKLEVDSVRIGFKNKIKENNMKYKIVRQAEDGKIISDVDKLMTYRNSKGEDIQVDSDVHAEFQAVKGDTKKLSLEVDTLKTENAELKKNVPADDKLKSLQIELDAEKVKSKTIQKSLDDKTAGFDSAVFSAMDEKMKLSKDAEACEVDTKGKTNDQIKREIISSCMEVDGSTLEADSVEPYLKAALELKREKATTSDVSDKKITVDSKDINSERAEALSKL